MLGATYVLRHPRTGGYWFRRRVPDHLRPMIGQQEITRSLRTRNLSEAKRLSRAFADATDQLFDQAALQGRSAEPAAPEVSPTPLEGRANAWVDEFIKARVAGGQGIVVNASPRVPAEAVPPPSPTAQEAPPPPITPPPSVTIPAQPSPQRVATVQEMFDRYLAEFERRPRTERTWRAHLDMFLEITGLSWTSPVHTVNDAHVEDFILALRKVPARRQNSLYKGLTLPEIITKFGNRADLPKLDQKTINNKVDSLRAVFYYAVRHKYIPENPFVGKVSKRAAKRMKPKTRLPFDSDDLHAIFDSELFRMPPHLWEGKQWIAAISLYSGARLSEIGQLQVTDLRIKRGIPYLAITTLNEDGTEEGVPEKFLKTAGSEREIPLHPALIKLGLPAHAQRMKLIGERRMFPDIRSSGGEITAAYSKWFGRFLTKVGITSPLKIFHSFRHGFKDACRNSGVPREIAEVLMGHAGRTVGDGYGTGYSMEVLAQEIAKVSFDLEWEIRGNQG